MGAVAPKDDCPTLLFRRVCLARLGRECARQRDRKEQYRRRDGRFGTCLHRPSSSKQLAVEKSTSRRPFHLPGMSPEQGASTMLLSGCGFGVNPNGLASVPLLTARIGISSPQ